MSPPGSEPVVVRRPARTDAPPPQENERIRVLEERVAALESEGGIHGGDRDAVLVDVKWKCSKCRALLGLWDPVRGQLRIRVRDGHIWVWLPSEATQRGARVDETCRGCGEVNRWPS